MATLHYMNVKEGDCSIIQHNSGRVTVIDVCNAKRDDTLVEGLIAALAKGVRGIGGNYQQKKYPVNPISYLRHHGVSSVFRYIQTHPDMDHLDGIQAFFEDFSPLNFWDTDNEKEIRTSSWVESPYNEQDWRFYKYLRDGKPNNGPKRLALLSGALGQFWNVDYDGSGGGDGLQIL